MTPAEILDQLDKAAAWPILEDESVDMAAVRLRAFGDGAEWALAIEVLGSSTGFGPTSIHTVVYSYGSQVEPAMSYVFSADVGPALDNLTGELRPDGYVLVRNRRLPVDLAPASLERKGIVPRYERPGDFELLLTLLPEERERLLATEEEVRERVGELPLLLELNAWNHPRRGEKPSDSETFRLLSRVLAEGKAEPWRPVTAPNTSYENWLS